MERLSGAAAAFIRAAIMARSAGSSCRVLSTRCTSKPAAFSADSSSCAAHLAAGAPATGSAGSTTRDTGPRFRTCPEAIGPQVSAVPAPTRRRQSRLCMRTRLYSLDAPELFLTTRGVVLARACDVLRFRSVAIDALWDGVLHVHLIFGG